MSHYLPDLYAKIVTPSDENSIEAMKARIKVLAFFARVSITTRNREQWIEGWKCKRNDIHEVEEEKMLPSKEHTHLQDQPHSKIWS